MRGTLEGADGIVCQMDDILTEGDGIREHDERLMKVVWKIQEARGKQNLDQTQFNAHPLFD